MAPKSYLIFLTINEIFKSIRHTADKTYGTQPCVIELCMLGLGCCDDPFAALAVGGVLPLWLDSFFEEMVIGPGRDVLGLGDVVIHPESYFVSLDQLTVVHGTYPQKSSTVSTVIICFKLSDQFVIVAFFPGLSNQNVHLFWRGCLTLKAAASSKAVTGAAGSKESC